MNENWSCRVKHFLDFPFWILDEFCLEHYLDFLKEVLENMEKMFPDSIMFKFLSSLKWVQNIQNIPHKYWGPKGPKQTRVKIRPLNFEDLFEIACIYRVFLKYSIRYYMFYFVLYYMFLYCRNILLIYYSFHQPRWNLVHFFSLIYKR